MILFGWTAGARGGGAVHDTEAEAQAEARILSKNRVKVVEICPGRWAVINCRDSGVRRGDEVFITYEDAREKAGAINNHVYKPRPLFSGPPPERRAPQAQAPDEFDMRG